MLKERRRALDARAEQISATAMALKTARIERALGAELSHPLGYSPGTAPVGTANQRMVWTLEGPLRIEVPRDRADSFKPILIPKHVRRFTGFGDKTEAV